MPTKDDFLKDMDRLENMFRSAEAETDKLMDVGFSPEAEILTVFYEVIDLACDLLADKYDIDRGAVSWFVFDNKFGEKDLSCKRDVETDFFCISCAVDFWDFEKQARE